MAEYTPTTEEIRERWMNFDGGPDATDAVEFDRWLAKVRAAAFSEGVDFIDGQPGPWGACMVAGRAEAARRRAEAEGVIDL